MASRVDHGRGALLARTLTVVCWVAIAYVVGLVVLACRGAF